MTVAENAGSSRILDIAAIKLRNATKRLRKAIATDAYGTAVDGDASGKMIGLRGVTAGDPGVESLVGGIDMDTYVWWRGFLDSSTTVLTWDALNAMWHDTKKFGEDNDAPTVMFTTPGVLEAYENSLSKRVMTGTAGTSYFSGTQFTDTMANNKRVAYGGYDAFYFKNIPMIED